MSKFKWVIRSIYLAWLKMTEEEKETHWRERKKKQGKPNYSRFDCRACHRYGHTRKDCNYMKKMWPGLIDEYERRYNQEHNNNNNWNNNSNNSRTSFRNMNLSQSQSQNLPQSQSQWQVKTDIIDTNNNNDIFTDLNG